jgi:hypothetical protein
MTPKAIAKLLILSALAALGATSASAEDGNFRNGRFFLHGRSDHGTRPPVTVGGFVGVDGYGNGGGYGNEVIGGNENGNPNGYGDWYGISSGHNDCPHFRQRVLTPDGWRIQMVPVC